MRRALSLLLLLALLGTGYGLAWVLSRQSEPLRDPGAVPLAGEAAGCDLARGPCEVAGLRLRLTGPARALTPIPFVVETTEPLQRVVLSLEMQGMDMGPNRHRARQTEKGAWRGEMMFPICVSGRHDWLVHVIGMDRDGRARRWLFHLTAEH